MTERSIRAGGQPTMERPPGFTLLELLVVVAIIAILAALLMPALSRAKERGKKAVCMSNLRQLWLSFTSYAEDNNQFYPPVGWDFMNIISRVNNDAISAGGFLPSYFPNRKVLRCPSFDPRIQTSGVWIYEDQYQTYWTTYFLIAGTGTYGANTSQTIDMRVIFDPLNSTPSNPRAVCPRRTYCGTSVTGYGTPSDYYGPYYVQRETEQPLATDPFAPSGFWSPYGFSSPTLKMKINHPDGINIVYVDGHVEWKTATQITPRCRDYYQYAYW